MLNTIIPFQFKSQSVRVTVVDDEPWWFAKDVCAALEIDNVSEATTSMEEDEKRRHTLLEPDLSNPDSGAIPRTYVLINESGLYSLVLRSRKPEAREFKRWLTREVLPSIRKTGTYAAGQLPEAKSPIGILKAREEFEAAIGFVKLFGITDTNQSLFAANNMVRGFYGVSPLELAGCAQLAAPTPAVSMTPTALGQELGGMRPTEVNKLLESLGLQTRVDGQWQATEAGEPHSVRVDIQKRHNKGAPVTQLKWFATVLDVLREALAERRASAT